MAGHSSGVLRCTHSVSTKAECIDHLLRPGLTFESADGMWRTPEGREHILVDWVEAWSHTRTIGVTKDRNHNPPTVKNVIHFL